MYHYCDKSFAQDILALSCGIAFLGSYLTICLVEQLRSTYIHHVNQNVWTRKKWYVLIGIALGGICMWSMHFVSMSALILTDHDTNEKLEIKFNFAVSLISLVCCVVTVVLGALVSSYDRLFAKSKKEILEMFVEESKRLSLKQIRQLKDTMIIKIMCTKDLKYLLTGGLISGSGICIMHYIGVAAMEYDGYPKWNAGIMAASVLVAMIASTTSYWIMFRVLSIFPGKESLRVASAFIMTVAVCGMHYISVAAGTIIHSRQDSTQLLPSPSIASDRITFPLVVTCMMIGWIISTVIFADLRDIVYKYRYQFNKHVRQNKTRHQRNNSINTNNSVAISISSSNYLGSSISSSRHFPSHVPSVALSSKSDHRNDLTAAGSITMNSVEKISPAFSLNHNINDGDSLQTLSQPKPAPVIIPQSAAATASSASVGSPLTTCDEYFPASLDHDHIGSLDDEDFDEPYLPSQSAELDGEMITQQNKVPPVRRSSILLWRTTSASAETVTTAPSSAIDETHPSQRIAIPWRSSSNLAKTHPIVDEFQESEYEAQRQQQAGINDEEAMMVIPPQPIQTTSSSAPSTTNNSLTPLQSTSLPHPSSLHYHHVVSEVAEISDIM